MKHPHIKIETCTVNVLACLGALAVILIGIIIIIGCHRMFLVSCENEKKMEERILRQDSLRAEFYANLEPTMAIDIDSVSKGLKSDNVSALLIARLKHLEGIQETLMADYRQETNNLINKVNGWIGFWVAMLALFGGLIPIVIQFVLNHKTKFEYDRLLRDIEAKTANSQMQLHVSTLWIDRTCSVSSNTISSSNLVSLMTAETITSLKNLLNHVEGEDSIISEANKIHLINALVQCYRLLDILKMRRRYRHTRRLNKLQSHVRSLIEDLFNLRYHPADEIYRRMHDLISNLYGISHTIDSE